MSFIRNSLPILLLWASLAQAAITCTEPGTTTEDFGVSSVSWSHPVAAGGNRLLLVGSVQLSGGTPPAVSTASFGAQALTNLTSAVVGGETRAEFWYVLAPTVQTASITLTYAGAVNAVTGALTCYDVHQSTPFSGTTSATGSGTAPSVAATSLAGHVVVDFLGTNTATATAGAGQTEVYENYKDTNVLGASSREAGAASVTMSWTVPSSNWVLLATSINPAAVVRRRTPYAY